MTQNAMKFYKFHGHGNDFVIIDNRSHSCKFEKDRIKLICDRNFGLGCDQLVLIEHPKKPNSDVMLRFFNQDGSESEMCGNALRCIGGLIFDSSGYEGTLSVEVGQKVIKIGKLSENKVFAHMGPAKTDPKDMELSEKCNDLVNFTPCTIATNGKNYVPTVVNVGNPHLIFFLDTEAECEELLNKYGSFYSTHEAFKNGTNVEFAFIKNKNSIIINVWERGVGPTLACGSGACATVYAAYLRGLVSSNTKIACYMPGNKKIGGSVDIEIVTETKSTISSSTSSKPSTTNARETNSLHHNVKDIIMSGQYFKIASGDLFI